MRQSEAKRAIFQALVTALSGAAGIVIFWGIVCAADELLGISSLMPFSSDESSGLFLVLAALITGWVQGLVLVRQGSPFRASAGWLLASIALIVVMSFPVFWSLDLYPVFFLDTLWRLPLLSLIALPALGAYGWWNGVSHTRVAGFARVAVVTLAITVVIAYNEPLLDRLLAAVQESLSRFGEVYDNCAY